MIKFNETIGQDLCNKTNREEGYLMMDFSSCGIMYPDTIVRVYRFLPEYLGLDGYVFDIQIDILTLWDEYLKIFSKLEDYEKISFPTNEWDVLKVCEVLDEHSTFL